MIVHARLRDGSLRQAATEAGAKVLLYEAGEAHRFDARAISTGADGVHRVISHLGIADHPVPTGSSPPQLTRRTKWARAPRSGVLHLDADLGANVSAGTQIASIYDTYGKRLSRVTTRTEGLVIGHTQRPLVNRGDAIINLADTATD